ncbi:MAG: MotA/TolQ/ExbB proton channel family protein [Burkholderiales bacterium]|nr:MotA/TolQ/ExbB proton channel family protein [Burkholderiales bacterium]
MKSFQTVRRVGAGAVATAMLGVSLLSAPLSVALAQQPAGGAPAAATGAATAPAAAPAATAAPAPATPAAAPAPFAPGKPATEKVENPYGLKALWAEGDVVAKSTLIIMVIMSVGTWYIMISKLLELAKVGRQAKAAAATFWSAPSVSAGIDTLKEQSPFRFLAEAAVEATKKHEGLLAHIGLADWLGQSIQRATDSVQSNLQNGLAFLATVGSTAPFVGLFGTVWGIYNALVKIGVSGQASIDKVAGPVGEALIMTAIGLAVAVPAVLGYNFIVRKNKTTMDGIRHFGSDLYSVLMASNAGSRRATDTARS